MAPGKRMAVLVGSNYFNTENELHGCINDVRAMRKLVTERFGFHPSHIQVLTDEPKSPVMPTGANIKRALNQMIDQAASGDVLFFHYSGHGTRIPSKYHHRKEEAIVPIDFNLITDLDFRQLANRVPRDATFTILSDSCHSGGLIDKEKEQIGPSSPPPTDATTRHQSHPRSDHQASSRFIPYDSILQHRASVARINHQARSKFIPYDSILQHLASVTQINSSDIGTHMTAHFGEDASPKFKLSASQPHHPGRLHPDVGILLSGCQANETSADMPGSEGGEAYGAFSNAIERVFKKHPSPLTNRQVVMMVRKLLIEQSVVQHPCLYCSDENADANFLCQT
ncbi:hypothetical protein Ancab_031222 [Ancistrocladus abbreviatus]